MVVSVSLMTKVPQRASTSFVTGPCVVLFVPRKRSKLTLDPAGRELTVLVATPLACVQPLFAGTAIQ